MRKQATAQVQVLKRVLYLLEENSVTHLGNQDSDFDAFIGHLYGEISDRTNELVANVLADY